jgi:hypothetical protein
MEEQTPESKEARHVFLSMFLLRPAVRLPGSSELFYGWPRPWVSAGHNFEPVYHL